MARLEHSVDGERLRRGNRSADGSLRRWLVGAIIGIAASIPWSVVSADVLTVGDHGTYSTIDAAIDAAVGTGSHEIRVEQGTYLENIFVGSALGSDSLEITRGMECDVLRPQRRCLVDGDRWIGSERPGGCVLY